MSKHRTVATRPHRDLDIDCVRLSTAVTDLLSSGNTATADSC